MGCCFGTQISPGETEIIKLLIQASTIDDDSELASFNKKTDSSKISLEISKDGKTFIEKDAPGSETERPIVKQEMMMLKQKLENMIGSTWEKKLLHLNLDSSDMSIDELPWLILRSKESKTDFNKYCLAEGDVIKLGRVYFRIRKIQPKLIKKVEGASATVSNKVQEKDFSFADCQTADPNSTDTSSNDLSSCRICLDCTNDVQNPILQICKCSGSMKYVHLDCIRKWVDNKILKVSSVNLLSFYHKSLTCEVCHAQIPSDILNNKRSYSLIDFPTLEEPHIILESFVGQKTNGFHILKFGRRIKSMKLGRNEKCDIKIKDDTIAPNHAVLDYIGENFYLTNTNPNHITQVLLPSKTIPFYQKNHFQLKISKIIMDLNLIRQKV